MSADMTDRELLELAAKAAGIEGAYLEFWGGTGIAPDDPNGGLWNPLADDGDALRLAVKLGLTVEADANDGDCAAYHPGHPSSAAVEWGGMDPDVRLAATRRAIVRAAAAIGSAA
jgi:hypothetical protein